MWGWQPLIIDEAFIAISTWSFEFVPEKLHSLMSLYWMISISGDQRLDPWNALTWKIYVNCWSNFVIKTFDMGFQPFLYGSLPLWVYYYSNLRTDGLRSCVAFCFVFRTTEARFWQFSGLCQFFRKHLNVSVQFIQNTSNHHTFKTVVQNNCYSGTVWSNN